MKKKCALIILAIIFIITSGCSTDYKKNNNNYIKLRWIVPISEQKLANEILEEANKIIRRKIGAELEIMFIEKEYYAEKMKMYMSADDDFDLCFTSSWLNDYESSVACNGLLDITDYISDSLKDTIPDYIMKQAEIEGRMYAIPNVQVISHPCALKIKKNYADKYKLKPDAIKTIDDIVPFLEQIKQNEPDVIPYKVTWGEGPWIRPYYEEVYNNTRIYIKTDGSSNKLIIGYDTPEYKRAIQTLREWYLKGYTCKDENVLSEDGKFVTEITSWKPGMEATDRLNGLDYLYIPLHKPYMPRNGASQAMTSVGANSKNPQKAYELIELMNTDKELYNLVCYGIKDINYEMTQTNKIKIKPESGYNVEDFAWVFGNQFNAIIPYGADDDIWKKTEKMDMDSIKSPLIGFVPDLSNIHIEINEIKNVIEKYKYQVSGIYDSECYWNDFVNDMDQAGYYKVLNELQCQVDKFFEDK